MTITAEQFAAQRHPVRGRSNPERMDMPVWRWLVETGLGPYAAAQQFDAPSAYEVGPGWTNQRMGQTRTKLPDGRVISIAGEHEDYYDPDFYIYNDVIVEDPGGGIEIYGYPEAVFAPTDFHSATLLGDEIWIVGSLGYAGKRRTGTTPVVRLSLDGFGMESISTAGEAPGWLHRHTATFDDDLGGIVVSRGILEHADVAEHYDNIDDWLLELPTLTWRRLTHRPYQQWWVSREDGERLCLFEMEQVAWDREHPDRKSSVDYGEQLGPRLRHLDFDVLRALYTPPIGGDNEDPIAAQLVEEDEEENEDSDADNTRFDRSRWRVGESIIRYADRHEGIAVKFEGPLEPAQITAVLDDLTAKLARLQGAPCQASRLV